MNFDAYFLFQALCLSLYILYSWGFCFIRSLKRRMEYALSDKGLVSARPPLQPLAKAMENPSGDKEAYETERRQTRYPSTSGLTFQTVHAQTMP